MQLSGLDSILTGVLNVVAPLVVSILGPFIAKKLHDRNLQVALATAADAALVFAISKSKSTSFSNLGELIREVVAGILANPVASSAVKNSTDLATQAAAAAIARAGIAGVQTVHVNSDGSIVPVTQIPR